MTRRECLLALAASRVSFASSPSLVEKWRGIARSTDGLVGAAVLYLKTGRLISLNGDQRFPLASVCKLPLAMNIFAMIDEGKLALDQEIEVLQSEIWPPVSDIAKEFPARRRFPVARLLEVMVAHSDNTAEETIYRIGGGAAAMAARFRQWGVEGVRIDRSERECMAQQADYAGVLRYLDDPRDTGTPNGTVQLLAKLFRGEALSRASTDRMIEILKTTTTGPKRLKGLLPPSTVVAHKTGTTGVTRRLAAGTNDSGVIYLPNGELLAISVYVKASTRSEDVRERVIARIARSAFDAA